GAFIFHIFGGKLPEELKELCGRHVIYEGYVDDLNTALMHMDIALVPSLYGAGMQQKVFEPLARGIPTVTSPRAIAKYPFKDGKSYFGASTAEEYVEALIDLRVPERRRQLSEEATRVSREEFNKEALDREVLAALDAIS